MDSLVKYHKLEIRSPNQDFLRCFNNLITQVKFNISFSGRKDESHYFINEKTIGNIKTIIYCFDIPDTSSCICGYGDEVNLILLYKNGNYGYISFNSLCFTDCEYNTKFEYENPEYSIEIADSIQNLIQYCLPDRSRKYYLQYLLNLNQYMYILNLYLPEQINVLILRYILDEIINSVAKSSSTHYNWFLQKIFFC